MKTETVFAALFITGSKDNGSRNIFLLFSQEPLLLLLPLFLRKCLSAVHNLSSLLWQRKPFLDDVVQVKVCSTNFLAINYWSTEVLNERHHFLLSVLFFHLHSHASKFSDSLLSAMWLAGYFIGIKRKRKKKRSFLKKSFLFGQLLVSHQFFFLEYEKPFLPLHTSALGKPSDFYFCSP